jgi:hypothetical protein
MFVDFNKYNNEIIAVNLNEYDDVLVMQTSLYKITLTAQGECCSRSKVKQFKNNDFNELIGKKIRRIKEINFPDDFTYEEESRYCISPHLYEIAFKNSNKTFQFMLINYSNGYYDGYLTTEIVL